MNRRQFLSLIGSSIPAIFSLRGPKLVKVRCEATIGGFGDWMLFEWSDASLTEFMIVVAKAVAQYAVNSEVTTCLSDPMVRIIRQSKSMGMLHQPGNWLIREVRKSRSDILFRKYIGDVRQ